MWDLIYSSAVIKAGLVTVQRSFIVINKPFAHAGGVLFKNIEGLFITSDLVLKRLVVYFCKGFWRRYFIICET